MTTDGPALAAMEPVPLPGPWRALVVPRPSSTTVSLCWLVDAGSRLDGDLPGLAWLTRQLVYAPRAATPRDLVSALDGYAAEVVCRTTREYSEYAATIAAPHRQALLGLLPELVREPALEPVAVQQGQLALASTALAPKSARALLWERLLAAAWPDEPFARPPHGTAEGALALTPDAVADWHAERYQPAHAVLAVVGACTVDEVASAVQVMPGRAPRGGQPPRNGAQARPAGAAASGDDQRAAGGLAHVAAAVTIGGMRAEDRSALRLLDYVAGHGGSSRLYRELREKRGLVYSCSSTCMPFADRGLFVVEAACAPERAAATGELLAEALLDLADSPPTADELAAAQTRYAGALYRAFEPNASLAAIVATETLLAEWEPFDVAIARVAAVTVDALAATARRFFRPERVLQVMT